MENKKGSLRVLEFYSGIGGLRYGLEYAIHNLNNKDESKGNDKGSSSERFGIEGVVSFDINDLANKVYQYNRENEKVNTKNLESISAEGIGQYQANVWLLSPPCQPYSRNGQQKDLNDPRAKSLIHLLEIFSGIKPQPDFILLENVVNFEVSQTRTLLINTLVSQCYCIQEYHLSPLQFGIPNQRMRYFLLASKNKDHCTSEYPLHTPIKTTFSPDDESLLLQCQRQPIKDFLLLNLDNEYKAKLKVPESVMDKKGLLFDIVEEDDSKSNCFTKAYGRYVEGTGSVLKMGIKENNHDLRYFSPQEIALLHCFPRHFEFPPTLTLRQCYQLLGNSLNVKVVGELLSLLLKSS